uniref:Uncharacterized protein n=1 Tax=Sphaerodactylus townsendi TaxID=933632 RepID=A0ACB8EC51_9SAUR
MGVGTLCEDVDGERAGFTCKPPRQRKPQKHLVIRWIRAAKEWTNSFGVLPHEGTAKRSRTEEVTQERDQLQSDLLDLRQQVAFLMAKREREKTALEPSTAEEGVTRDDTEGELRAKLRSLWGELANLTLNRSPYHQGVGSYMEVHGSNFYLDRERVFEIGTWLRGEVDNWLVGLVEEDVPELYNLEQFLLALRQRFEDPLAEEKARGELKRLQQGNRSVSEFATDFLRLASHMRGRPELVLVQLFKDALHPKVLQWALIHGDPETLMEWIRWAGDAELRIWQVE